MTVVHSTDVYPRGHPVFKFVPSVDRWFKGEVVHVFSERRADERVHTCYSVAYREIEQEKVEHEEIKERIRGKQYITLDARVRKYVPRTGRFLHGFVATITFKEAGAKFYNVEYEDGEKEELSQLETEEILVDPPQLDFFCNTTIRHEP